MFTETVETSVEEQKNTTHLDRLASEINACLAKADSYQGKADDFRISAGLRLKEAHENIPRGQWGLWLKDNIKRSRKDVYRCLALVKSDDPKEQQVAREKEKEDIREQVRKSRMCHTYDTNNPRDDDVITRVSQEKTVENIYMMQAKSAFQRLSMTERGEFLQWVKQTGLY